MQERRDEHADIGPRVQDPDLPIELEREEDIVGVEERDEVTARLGQPQVP
jgi:hypothetical protein